LLAQRYAAESPRSKSTGDSDMLITEMPFGAPCWFELASTDPGKSFAFYSGLFGWKREDIDMGPMGIYSFLSNASGMIGAMMKMPPGPEMPSHWGVYFLVANCDESTAMAVSLGATQHMAPMDVSTFGRMSILGDPTGAVFSLWQAKEQGGPGFAMFEDYAIGWVELATRDVAKAEAFYSALLGWQFAKSSGAATPEGVIYREYGIGATHYGGLLQMTREWGEMPAHWSIYIPVPDVDACVAKAKTLGGTNTVPAFDAPGVGRIAMLADPTGANTYVIKLNR
jgi:predicted enzyme related to lactoylglutathione lyase